MQPAAGLIVAYCVVVVVAAELVVVEQRDAAVVPELVAAVSDQSEIRMVEHSDLPDPADIVLG